MADSFFLPGMCKDKAYLNLRDLPPELSEEGRRLLVEARSFIEELWQEFKPLADKPSQKDAQNHFIQRFWEMYLGVALIRQGYRLEKPSDKGPEFFFRLDNKKVWVEAIAPGPGESPDAVPKHEPAVDPRDIIAISVPEEKILLRFTHALDTKIKKYEEDLNKGLISPCDPYVLAINGRQIPHATYGGALPYPVNAFLGIGPPAVVLDRIKGDILDSYFERREYVSKISGGKVSTAMFLDSNCSAISGVLYSSVDPVNRPKKMGDDFIFIHNPLAKNPIARDIFGWCRQYWLDGEELHVVESNPSLNADTPD